MSSIPTDRKYTKTHEWLKLDGDMITLGITQFAADELTDITFVELPEAGSTIEGGTSFGEIESVKATGDLFSPVGGEVAESNAKLADEPGLVNSDPFGEGWMIKVKAADTSPLDDLLDAAAYEEMLKQG